MAIEVAQSTVSIYMVPRRDRPRQTWKTFSAEWDTEMWGAPRRHLAA
jgi:hypothetical protein